MARTSTEFKMKDGILEALNNYLAERGYSQGELEGCIGWGKEILPAISFFLQTNSTIISSSAIWGILLYWMNG